MPEEEGGDLRSALPAQRLVGKWVEATHHCRVNLWSSIIGHHRQGVEIPFLSIHLAFDRDHTLPRTNNSLDGVGGQANQEGPRCGYLQ